MKKTLLQISALMSFLAVVGCGKIQRPSAPGSESEEPKQELKQEPGETLGVGELVGTWIGSCVAEADAGSTKRSFEFTADGKFQILNQIFTDVDCKTLADEQVDPVRGEVSYGTPVTTAVEAKTIDFKVEESVSPNIYRIENGNELYFGDHSKETVDGRPTEINCDEVYKRAS